MTPRRVLSLSEVDESTLSNIAKACGIPEGLIVDVYDCTPIQLSMITETRAEVLHFILSFGPAADIDRFCQAIRQVVSTNAVLRTRIVECSLGVVQVVTSEEHVTEHLSGDLEQYLDNDQTRRVGYGTNLFRTAFIDRVLVATIHHAVMDHVSVAALLGEDLPAAYYGLAPKLRPSFKRFVTQYTNIDEPTARSFWATRFKGAPAIFPRVKPGAILTPIQRAGKTIRPSRIGAGIPPTHLPYYIEAAWALTAATYAASDSVAYGYVLSGRSPTLHGVDVTLGPTIAEVPVQVNLQRNMTVESLIKDRATALRQLQMHPASQYGVAAIGAINKSTKIASGFQTLLNIVPVLPMSSEEASVKYDGVIWRGGSFALQLVCRIRDNVISVEPRSDPVLGVCDDQLHRILNQFEHILQLLIELPPHTKLHELPLLNDRDHSEILSWNKPIPQATENCLHELFRARARAQPEAVAVEARDGHASYSRLDQMSDLLAGELRSRGVSPGQPVALIFEKSLWAIVAILGIMKSGGLCVPIDKDDRYDRKANIISLSKASMILTSSTEHSNSASLATDVLPIGPDFAIRWPELRAPENPGLTSPSGSSFFSAENLASIIFTGTSTGALQGVLLEHRSLASSLTWNAQRLGWGPNSRVFQFASYASSMSLIEIFGALLFGGCLCIPDGEACGRLGPKSKEKVSDSVTSVKANWAMLPPSVLRTMSPNQVPRLRWLASIGEPIDAEASERWGTGLRFFNCWGSCGASILSTVAELGPLCPYPESNIGRPVGCAVWIVNPRDPNKLCPIGAVGELWVEGPGVARCYLRDEGTTTTRASFISAPPAWGDTFREKNGARLYRTGDLGRYNPDGSISFVGRLANQVKSAGQTLQVEEIEEALISCKEIEDVAVLTKISAGRTQLVAVVCLVDSDNGQPTMTILKELGEVCSVVVEKRIDAIRDYARSRLLSHMVPTTWLTVEQLPRSTSGKLDRASISTWLRTREK
ncbi:putative aminoadipate-semialdehyde dehydrogenase [Xylaria telfairii]|nr:putative aminoadipate-semialdehyde dehydrogenase [Xylaria telfairii]